MKRKLPILLLIACLMFGCVSLVISADAAESSELVVLLEENFEEYEADINVNSTTLKDFFVCDYNAIGDGVIHVQESTSGNLHLKSHVFTQIYCATPIIGAYELSLDILEAQGSMQTGVFVRAPMTKAAFYEADGHPNTSVTQAGLLLYTRGSSLGVNVKTYNENANETAYLDNNTVEFSLPAGTSHPYNVRVVDNGEEIRIYVDDTLMCRITLSDPGKSYARHESEGKCFGAAKLYDASGAELGSYTDTLLCSDHSYVGWTTRAADMRVDNVVVKAEVAYQTILAIGKLPTKVTEKNVESAKELAAEARALYDSLPEEKKALVINTAKLTKIEAAIAELEVPTEAPTEAPTEPPTEMPTETPTEAPTNAQSSPDQDPETQGETEPSGVTPEPRVIDDSLAVWILIAVMLVAVGIAAGYITVKVRK